MKIQPYLKHCFFLILTASTFASCEKGPQEEFLKTGEIIYTGKPDNLHSFAGLERNKLTWYLVSDPKIIKAKVFWNNPALPEGEIPTPGDRNSGRDSVVIDIERTSGNQLIEVMIDRLNEGVFTFDVFTYDKDGNSSIKTEVIGEAYADTYQNSISNRPLDSAVYYPSSKEVKLKWFGVAQQAGVIDVIYTDVSGELKTMYIRKVIFDPRKPGVFLDRDVIPNYKAGTTFQYRTGYLPATTAIDTFYTAYKEVTPTVYVPPLPPPPPPPNLALATKVTASSAATQFLTDGDRGATNKWQPDNTDRPDLNVWFYVDLGAAKDINTTQIYFTKDPAKVLYYEILVTEEATISTSTKWKRAFIKLVSPSAADINTFTKIKARHVKVNIALKEEATTLNVSELEIYNK